MLALFTSTSFVSVLVFFLYIELILIFLFACSQVRGTCSRSGSPQVVVGAIVEVLVGELLVSVIWRSCVLVV